MLSPIQHLQSIGSNFYIKREDLINGLFNGIKERKIRSLIKAIEEKKPKVVFLKGSLYSNFFLAIVPKLRTLGIPFKLFTNQLHIAHPEGNYFFLKLLTNPDEILPIDSLPPVLTDDIFLVEEGGDHLASYLGLMSLGEEILTQMKLMQLEFDEIWIDAGTCSTAIVLLYSLSQAKIATTLKIVSMKEDEKGFLAKKEKIFQALNSSLKKELKETIPFEVIRPVTAKSFGSTNTQVFETILNFARKTGIILDPVYSSKLFLTLKECIQEKKILMIHSGGNLSLTGFKEKLKL